MYVMYTMKSSQMTHAIARRCNLALSSAFRRPGLASAFGAFSWHSMSWSLPTSFVPLSLIAAGSRHGCEVSHRVAGCSNSTAMMLLGDGASASVVVARVVPALSTIASSTAASSVTRRRCCLCNTLASMTVCDDSSGFRRGCGAEGTQSAGELMQTFSGAVPSGACHVRLAVAAFW
eukprot:scaffold71390_cov61-Phaeocystis_antarctica.AAC.2